VELVGGIVGRVTRFDGDDENVARGVQQNDDVYNSLATPNTDAWVGWDNGIDQNDSSKKPILLSDYPIKEKCGDKQQLHMTAATTATTDKAALKHRLANLLGISLDDDHEYLSDILESLLDIGDNPDDVAEYLSSFGAASADGDEGIGGYDVQQFAHDVKKFKSGEDISSNDTKVTCSKVEVKHKPKMVVEEAAAQREEIKRREIVAREKQRLLKQKREEEEEQRHRREEAAMAKLWENKTNTGTQNEKAIVQQPSVTKSNAKMVSSKGTDKQATAEITKKKQANIQPAKKEPMKPQKGEPKNKACGCYGNVHKPLTNCLHCGRISCEVEGINEYCHFCGNLIQDYDATSSDSARMHKERLLEFDRTSAARTQIHDDQEDYFVASTSMWSDEQEQEAARVLEEKRQEKLKRQKNQTLNIVF